MKIFSVDRLHKMWMKSGPRQGAGPVKDLKMLQGLKEDFALTCIIGKGNDYLPAVQGATALNPTPGIVISTSSIFASSRFFLRTQV